VKLERISFFGFPHILKSALASGLSKIENLSRIRISVLPEQSHVKCVM
jgi:hypothetical protein